MKLKKCTFEKDDWGLYITPMIGFNRKIPSGAKTSKRELPERPAAIWFGWLWWLWTIEFD